MYRSIVDLRECRGSRSHVVGVGLAVAFLASVLTAAPLHADYRVQAGDVIEIFIAGIPELQRRVQVQPNGSISFPLLGSVVVEGMSQSQLQATIQAEMATKVFQHRASDGREISIPVAIDAVMATVVEYRPIYVDGDVAKPGEYTYRPFMTIRQALAVAGGLDPMRVRLNNPYFEAADLRADYASSWVELAREEARVARTRVEVGYEKVIDRGPLIKMPVPKATLTRIADLESAQLKTRDEDHDRQKEFLRRSIEKGKEQIRVLTEQQEKERQGALADTEELQRTLELYGKGALPSPRVTDARRAVLLSATRNLQTATQLMQLSRQQDELLRQMEKLDDQRKIEALKEMQDATVRAAALRAKLQGIAEKMQYASFRSDRINGKDLRPVLAVVRKDNGQSRRLSVDENFVLAPGDVIEVTLQFKGTADSGYPDATAGMAPR
jgi:polysaccharide export outer membrane protein